MDIDINGERLLKEAVTEVFETMVFMDILPLTPPHTFPDMTPSVLSTVSCSGQYNGVLSLTCAQDCAKAITMNVLAMDDESEMDDSDIPDAMGEMANMTMGSLKSRLYEKMGELSVSVPTVITGLSMSPQARDGAHMEEALVEIDGMYPMHLNFVYSRNEA